jgi:hypothetical protein
LVAEYGIHPSTHKFADLEVVPESRPPHVGSTPTFRRDVFDLSVPRQIAEYDKLGGSLLVSALKYYLFQNSKIRLTKKLCEEFFENDSNFVL